MTPRTLTRAGWTALALLVAFGLSAPALADSKTTADSLAETVRLLESGQVGNVSDFCPYLRRELDRARRQLDTERRDLRRAIENPPRSDRRDGQITRGWARNIQRRERRIQSTAQQLEKLQRRIDNLCPRPLGAARPPAAPAGAPAGPSGSTMLAGARIVVTPSAFAGGRLSGQVVGADGQPMPQAPLTVGTDGQIGGFVVTDPEGRFQVEVPEQGDRIGFAVLGTDAVADSRLVTVGEMPTWPSPSAGSLVQPDSQLDLAGHVELPWIEQDGHVMQIPSALSVSPDGRHVVSSVHCPPSLTPGAATLGYSDGAGSQQTVDVAVYAILDSFLEQDLLRAGQSAGFGWTIDLGPGEHGSGEHGPDEHGTLVEICARESGPIVLTGVRCQTADAGPDGTVRYASSIRAQSVTGEVPFSLEPEIEIQDRPRRERMDDTGDVMVSGTPARPRAGDAPRGNAPEPPETAEERAAREREVLLEILRQVAGGDGSREGTTSQRFADTGDVLRSGTPAGNR